MSYIIIAFRARSHTINFANLLRSYNVYSEIINTPRVVNISCGISVKFLPKDLNVVLSILQRRHFDTFGGIFEIIGNNGNQKVRRIK